MGGKKIPINSRWFKQSYCKWCNYWSLWVRIHYIGYCLISTSCTFITFIETSNGIHCNHTFCWFISYIFWFECQISMRIICWFECQISMRIIYWFESYNNENHWWNRMKHIYFNTVGTCKGVYFSCKTFSCTYTCHNIIILYGNNLIMCEACNEFLL